ncbi:MAG: DUF998 domain-containing protein [Sphingosinicella sp.]|nr:DUF998 domain-containing protein [Sphingosinicella sp.]
MSSDLSTIAARGAIAAAAMAILALAVLHLVRADLHPSRHMISEYAIGANGWIMGVCFAAFAVASAALLVSLLGSVNNVVGWLGLAALAAAAIGLFLGGAFPMDPATASPENMSFSGRMHGVGFMVGVPGMILAALLLSLALRGQAGWNGPQLLLLTAVIWVSLAVMAWALMNFMKQPDGPTIMGWANRLLMVSYAAWIMVAAWPKARWSLWAIC